MCNTWRKKNPEFFLFILNMQFLISKVSLRRHYKITWMIFCIDRRRQKSPFILNHLNSFWTSADRSNICSRSVLFAIISTQKKLDQWRRGVVVITTAQLHSTKLELRLCAGSYPAHGVSEIRDGEDLWQWSRLEIRLNAFHQSTIPQKQFIIIIIIIINVAICES